MKYNIAHKDIVFFKGGNLKVMGRITEDDMGSFFQIIITTLLERVETCRISILGDSESILWETEQPVQHRIVKFMPTQESMAYLAWWEGTMKISFPNTNYSDYLIKL